MLTSDRSSFRQFSELPSKPTDICGTLFCIIAQNSFHSRHGNNKKKVQLSSTITLLGFNSFQLRAELLYINDAETQVFPNIRSQFI